MPCFVHFSCGNGHIVRFGNRSATPPPSVPTAPRFSVTPSASRRVHIPPFKLFTKLFFTLARLMNPIILTFEILPELIVVIRTRAAIAKQRTSIFNRSPSPSTDQRRPTASQAHYSCPTHSDWAKVARRHVLLGCSSSSCSSTAVCLSGLYHC